MYQILHNIRFTPAIESITQGFSKDQFYMQHNIRNLKMNIRFKCGTVVVLLKHTLTMNKSFSSLHYIKN